MMESPCHNATRLHEHLQGTLLAPEESDFVAHLGTCEFCQQSLVTIAAQDDWLLRAAARAGREPATVDPRLSAVLSDLKTAKDDVNAVEDAPHWRDFLAPTDDPRYLGQLEQYCIISLVGQGGMGIVLKAFDEKLERTVAIKLLSPWMLHHPAARSRFLREARAAAAVRHDNVVIIHDVNESGRIPYLVMEYIEGQSLQERLDQNGPLDWQVVLRIGIEAANALSAAHAHGLIHRDIKPANILLEDGKERVKITDFGLARALEDTTTTSSGIAAGTPGYMAPEQARAEAVDYRADLFSLGGVLYTLCTGRPPFEADSALATLKQVCESEPEPIQALNPTVPMALVGIIAKLQAKDPGDRFQTAEKVIAALVTCQGFSQTTKLPRVNQHGSTQPQVLSSRRILAAAALFVVGGILAAQIIIRIRDKEGNTTELTVPEGSSVTLETNGSTTSLTKPQSLGDGEVRRFLGHKGSVYSVAITRDGTRIVSGSTDASARVWDTATGNELVRFEGHASGVYSAAILPDGRRVLSGSGGNPGDDTPDGSWSVCLWDLESGKALNRLDGRGDSITAIACDADGRRALVASYNGTILLWDIENWRQIKRLQESRGVWSVCFSPDESQVLVAGGHENKPVLRLWDLTTSQQVMRFDGHDPGCWQAIFTTDGRRILSTGLDRMIKLWDVKTGSFVQSFRAAHATTGAALSADGKILVSGNHGVDKTVLVWNVETGEQIKAFGGHTSGVQSVAISPDGRWAVSGSHDNTVRLWKLPMPEKQTKE